MLAQAELQPKAWQALQHGRNGVYRSLLTATLPGSSGLNPRTDARNAGENGTAGSARFGQLRVFTTPPSKANDEMPLVPGER